MRVSASESASASASTSRSATTSASAVLARGGWAPGAAPDAGSEAALSALGAMVGLAGFVEESRVGSPWVAEGSSVAATEAEGTISTSGEISFCS